MYKSHAVHVATGEPAGSLSRPPAKRKAGVVRPTAFWTLDGLGDVEKINGHLDEYSKGKGLVQLVVRP